MITDFKFVQAESLAGLESAVKAEMVSGWEPSGALSIDRAPTLQPGPSGQYHSENFILPMVKREDAAPQSIDVDEVKAKPTPTLKKKKKTKATAARH